MFPCCSVCCACRATVHCSAALPSRVTTRSWQATSVSKLTEASRKTSDAGGAAATSMKRQTEFLHLTATDLEPQLTTHPELLLLIYSVFSSRHKVFVYGQVPLRCRQIVYTRILQPHVACAASPLQHDDLSPDYAKSRSSVAQHSPAVYQVAQFDAPSRRCPAAQPVPAVAVHEQTVLSSNP